MRSAGRRLAVWVRILLAVACLPAALAQGAPPVLGLPLRCVPGQSCWVANHVDREAGPGARDFTCGAMTYDGHDGTDFALRDLRAMQAGVEVLAAAAGIVAAVRDGVADASVAETGRAAVAGRECGNGLAIDHADGWQTRYCHLRQGSLRVRAGQRVAAGEVLGLVGMSGLSEYPHLHFSVNVAGLVVDPYDGGRAGAACASSGTPLWGKAIAGRMAYAPGSIYNLGVAPDRPDESAVRAGRFAVPDNAPVQLARDMPAMVLFAELFGVAPGDTLSLAILAPDGQAIIRREVVLPGRQARRLEYAGRRAPPEGWAPGVYRAQVELRPARPSQQRVRAAGFDILVR